MVENVSEMFDDIFCGEIVNIFSLLELPDINIFFGFKDVNINILKVVMCQYFGERLSYVNIVVILLVNKTWYKNRHWSTKYSIDYWF